MTKERWNRCKDCGTITDVDEKMCPMKPRLKDNPEHALEVVELTPEEVKKLWKERKIYTKHVADVEERLAK